MTILSNSNPVIHLAWIMAIALSVLVGALAGSLFLWRVVRVAGGRASRRTLALIQTSTDRLLDSSLDYQSGLRTLRDHLKAARLALLDFLPVGEDDAYPERVATLRRICADLGLVDLWRRQLIRRPSGWRWSTMFSTELTRLERIPSLSFVVRAEAAESLGRIRDPASWLQLASALDDSHLAVRSAAARALARIRAPSSFPVIARKLADAALGNGREISVRTLKMALAGFPLAYASDLADMLQHPHRRVRFLAADIIASMVQRTVARHDPHDALVGPVAEIFLTRLWTDPHPDVRARAADVIAHLDDDRAAKALLVLIEDGEWFVRLHTVRALGRHRPWPIEPLGRCLTDSNWRVREAAAQEIAAQGPRGVGFLLAHYGATPDRYSREQVAEQIERAGFDTVLGGVLVST